MFKDLKDGGPRTNMIEVITKREQADKTVQVVSAIRKVPFEKQTVRAVATGSRSQP